jgi:DNA-binding transcriptional ArsR family regulator
MLSLAALADPTRRQIVELLARGELPAGAIADRFDITAPAISQHLKTLREAHLVRVRIDALRRIYQLDPAGFSELDAWLAGMRRFWAVRLDALGQQLRRTTPPAPRRRPGKKKPKKGPRQ